MHKNFYGWSLENINKGKVDTVYTIEYIDNKKTWDKMCCISDNYCSIDRKTRKEPWEFYSKREFDNIESALEFYMVRLIDSETFDIKMFEQIYVNGELIIEQFIEPNSTVKFNMENILNKEMRQKIDNLERRVQQAKESVRLYQNFMKLMGEKYEQLFNEFIKRRDLQ